jgi:hypothetical protein
MRRRRQLFSRRKPRRDTNDDSMTPVAINANETEENDVIEEEDQTTDTARLLRSFFEEWAGIQV